jgi:hypothetical protein
LTPARPQRHREHHYQAADLRQKRNAGDARHGDVIRRDRSEARGEPAGEPRSGVGLRISHCHGRQPPDFGREIAQFGVDGVSAHGLAADLAQGKERRASLA